MLSVTSQSCTSFGTRIIWMALKPFATGKMGITTSSSSSLWLMVRWLGDLSRYIFMWTLRWIISLSQFFDTFNFINFRFRLNYANTYAHSNNLIFTFNTIRDNKIALAIFKYCKNAKYVIIFYTINREFRHNYTHIKKLRRHTKTLTQSWLIINKHYFNQLKHHKSQFKCNNRLLDAVKMHYW